LTVLLLFRIAIAIAINAVALWVADLLFDSMSIHGFWSYFLAALVLAIANAIIKPILTILTLPLIIVTLGLFLLVINIAMIGLAEWIAPNFSIDGFWTYVGVIVILWLVNWIADALGEMFEGEDRRVLA
jgi:putative membrane protein